MDLGSQHAAAQAVLAERHYVQFHPAIAHLLGGLKPALMLGHALYWTRNWMVAKKPARDGWFWKTAAEWRDATGLSSREQESAREVLRNTGIWHETLLGGAKGQGTRLHFRVDLTALTRQLLQAAGQAAPPGSDANAAASQNLVGLLPRLLAKPVLFFRSLADVAGGAPAGLLLSWLLTQFGDALAAQATSAEGFFLFDQDGARQALMLGPKALRNARDALERSGLVSIGYACESQGRLMVRVNLMALTACLSGQKPPVRKRLVRSASPLESVPVQSSLLERNELREQAPSTLRGEILGAARTQAVDRAQVVGRSDNVTRVLRMLLGPQEGNQAQRRTLAADTADLPFCRNGAPANGLPLGRFVETGGAVLSNSYPKGFLSKETPPPEQADREAARRGRFLKDKPSNSGQALSHDSGQHALAEGLVMPEHLDVALHPMAQDIVRHAPLQVQQALLDELEGTLTNRRRSIDNPLGWLHAVVNKAKAGTLVLTAAPLVVAAREAAKAKAVRMASANLNPAPEALATTQSTYEMTEAARAAQSRIAEVLARMKGKPMPPTAKEVGND